MALLIEKNIEVFPGITIPQVYVRLEYTVDEYGVKLTSGNTVYSSREAYEEQKNLEFIRKGDPLSIYGIPHFISFPYNKDIEGIDVLEISHENVKHYLSTDQTEQQPVIDPSTGQPEIDPSTGEIIYETVIIIPKFAQDTSIFIVDVD